MEPSQADLKKTPLNAVHRQMGARMVPFGGWDMPVQYSGILAEHRAVRGSAGLFDISHMGEIELTGPSALAAVQSLVTSDASKLQVGQVQYAALCYDNGTFVDDLTVYKLADDHFMLTVNASNIVKDVAWSRDPARGRVAAALISRAGYAGEDGFEIYLSGARAEALWRRLQEAGKRFGMLPVGLG